MIPEQSSGGSGKGQGKRAKKDLLRLQRPIYELKRDEEGKPESIIARLMEQKQKPQIGFLPRSQLFEQLDKFIPVLKQSNQQLLKTELKPEMQFDAKLEQVEDSSSSSEEDEEAMGEGAAGERMEVEQEKPQFLESVEEFQFNILKYPYLPKEEPSAETKVEEKQTVLAMAGEALAGKFERVVEIKGENPLEQLE